MATPEDQTKAMIAGMLKSLENEDMQGLSLDNLKDVMAHPKAAESVAELMPLEASSVKRGEPAPDFTLPYLPRSLPRSLPGSLSNAAAPSSSVTLSDHFGKRPVALIFGSYT